MAVRRKIKVRKVSYTTILLIALVILTALFWSCEPVSEHSPKSNDIRIDYRDKNSAQIEDAQVVYVHLISGGIRYYVQFVRFKFNGHYYITKEGDNAVMFHSPDCDCQSESSSVSSSFGSSSLFNW